MIAFSEYEINEVNTGICIVDNELLFKYIEGYQWTVIIYLHLSRTSANSDWG